MKRVQYLPPLHRPAPTGEREGRHEGLEESPDNGTAAEYCQICKEDENEELVLMCDSCDKGCHTFCHKPMLAAIPDGHWFCSACVAKPKKEEGEKNRMKKGEGSPPA
ncbi:bromodomain adjacent to zinc finger domain protein 2B-like isoform X3 [Synchiropus splendidus]|uniref:bromodomain adjacent to zinc finger domain protein 2B-like isoform X3 n=1 Tax=Synchiropus splendidus TaxID=270530 RepID=UPI00237D68E3|nr:bromodomain adjacent to zinc finger domain protein 2B-like isoform X3 [Synchiropus splendidus]